MTRVDFYTLKAGAPGDRLQLACRLVVRALDQRQRILIHCADEAQARTLDRLLWTFREDSFIPHGLVGETDPLLTPVLLSTDGEPLNEDQVLINLALTVPTFFDRFERLCEPIDHDAAVRAAGRTRWAWYKSAGYPLAHHEVS